jgi:hypothetical protein
LTVFGRQLLDRVVVDHWTVARAAEAAGVSRQTAIEWVRRYREFGSSGLEDRSSRPHRSPRTLPPAQVAAIVAAHHELGVGPHRPGTGRRLATLDDRRRAAPRWPVVRRRSRPADRHPSISRLGISSGRRSVCPSISSSPTRTGVRLYRHLERAEAVDELADRAATAIASGYTAVKVDPVRHDHLDLERAEAVDDLADRAATAIASGYTAVKVDPVRHDHLVEYTPIWRPKFWQGAAIQQALDRLQRATGGKARRGVSCSCKQSLPSPANLV